MFSLICVVRLDLNDVRVILPVVRYGWRVSRQYVGVVGFWVGECAWFLGGVGQQKRMFPRRELNPGLVGESHIS